MEIEMIKSAGGIFVPVFEHDLPRLEKFKNGEQYTLEARLTRNPAFHRKMFAFLNFCFQHWNAEHAGYEFTDEQVYIGDTAKGAKGLLNLPQVTPTNAAKTFATSTPDEIRAAINQVLSNAWVRSAYSKVPEDLLIPPEQYSFLASTIVSSAGNQSLLTYLETNTIAFHQNGKPLNIRPVKWVIGRGVANKDRMVAYTNDKKFVRFPMVPLQSVPIQYRGLYQLVTYYGKLGAVEPVYPETLNYMDGI